MDDLLVYGVETLGGMLKENSNTKMAFKSIVNVFEDISNVINEENKGIVQSFIRKVLITTHGRFELT